MKLRKNFFEFFTGLIELADKMEIDFDPDYLMMDSSDATYNAAVRVFNSKILMCYYHMKANIKKNCQSLFKSECQYEELLKQIDNIHYSRSEKDFQIKVKEFKDNYSHKSLKEVRNYVCIQWLDNPKWSKWQIYHSLPGYANTNSNLESFNRQIKIFTLRKKLSVFGMVNKCEDMIHYYSSQQRESFHIIPKYKENLNNVAIKMDKSVFKKISSLKILYKEKYLINKIEKTCSCAQFLKKAICIHSLAYSHLKDLNWFGTAYSNRSNEFCYRTKKGRSKGHRYKKSTQSLMFESD